MVYRYVFYEKNIVKISSTDRRSNGEERNRALSGIITGSEGVDGDVVDYPTKHALLRVSKRIYYEALPSCYGINLGFSLTFPSSNKFLKTIGPTARGSIQELTLRGLDPAHQDAPEFFQFITLCKSLKVLNIIIIQNSHTPSQSNSLSIRRDLRCLDGMAELRRLENLKEIEVWEEVPDRTIERKDIASWLMGILSKER